MCLRIMCAVFVCPQRGHTLVRLKYTASYLRRYAALSKPSFNFFNSSVKVLTLLDIFSKVKVLTLLSLFFGL